MKKQKRDTKYIRIGAMLLVIGTIGLSIPFVTLSFLQERAFSNDSMRITAQATQTPFIKADEAIPEVTPTPTPDYNRSGNKNRLIIAKAGIDMALYDGDISVLNKGGWVYPYTSTPDQGNNTVIFGHRFRYLPPIKNTLFHLDKVGVGDEIRITWQGQQYTYKIIETKIIEPTDLTVLEKSDKPIITLITCTPLFSTKQRLVVVAELVSGI